MRRLGSALSLVCVLAGCALVLSCSKGISTQVVNNPVPASVSISPAPNASIEVGKTISFVAFAANSQGNSVTETFTYQSTNPSVLTISNNGVACAGSWDSLASPTVCTPGSTGTAQVTAIANGVSSPPVTVYVHQHVTRVVIQVVPSQPPTLSTTCFSKGAPLGPERVFYQAFAYAGTAGTTDITPSVGQFTWTAAAVASQGLTGAPVVLTSPSGTPMNQRLATAGIPGSTSIFASAGGTVSQPIQFTTCLVQKISLSVLGSPSPTTTSFNLGASGSATVNATVTDSIGMPLTGLSLAWSSSYPRSVAVGGSPSSVYASVGAVTGSSVGQASITASCTPPACNGGIVPSMPIYPTNALSFQVTPGASTPIPTAYVTTTACGGTTLSCTTRLVPITRNTSSFNFSAGTPVNLASTPNSIAFGRTTTLAYLGVDSTGFNSQGLMIFSGSSASALANAAGKVLAVSPDSATAILSDTVDSPSRVNICTSCNNSVRAVTTVFFPNATAAAFSPDGLKAYIVSGTSCPGTSSAGCILVYSKLESLQYVQLSAKASGAAFIGNGSAGYVAESKQTSFLPTCGPNSAAALGSVNLAADFLQPLPDGMSLLSLTPPTLQSVTATITGNPPVNASGCPSPRGVLNIANAVGPSFDLGTGSFTVKQFFLSADGSVAYILASTAGGARFPFIITFNVNSGTSSQISLAGNAVPLSAAVSPAGNLLFVGADDNAVHLIDTTTGLDTQQIALSFPDASLCISPGNPATQATIASLTITAAQQIATNTTFTYSLANGSTPQPGQTLVLTGMADSGNNGTFTILSVNAATASTGTVTVSDPAGATATGQAGAGTVPLSCNPDLIGVSP